MSLFQDHLIASVAAAGVLLTTSNLQHQRAFEVINQTRLQSAQTALNGFTDVLAQDIRSMGSGVRTGDPMILGATENSVTFRGTADQTATARTIRYVWATVLNDEGEPVVEVQREVDGVHSVQSPPLESFELELLDAAGASTEAGDVGDTRRVRVSAALDMPDDEISEDAPVRSVGWETEFAPANLARRGNESPNHPLLTLNVSLSSFGD